MKRLKTIGLMLLAVSALGAFAASTAFATEGLLPQQGATAASGTGGPGTLETLGGEKITCKALNILNILFDANSDHHGTADLHFTGCLVAGLFPANTLLDAKEVILVKVLFLLCLITPASLVFGMWIEPDETVHIEVPSLGQLLLVKGAVIAQLTGPLGGKEFNAKLAGENGDQKTALTCEREGIKLSHTLVAARDSVSDEDASENRSFTIKFSTAVQLEDK